LTVKMKLDNYRMKDGKIGHRTADIQDDVVPEIGEHNLPWLELALRNQDGCSSQGCKNWNLIKSQAREIGVHLFI
jgi:hypothetical protein